VSREFDDLALIQAERLLERAANLHEDLLALLDGAAFATGYVAVTAAWEGLADSARPDTDTVETLANVHNNAHDLAIVLVLDGLADGSEHNVQPKGIDVDELLILEAV